MKIKVLIIDDSATARNVLKEILEKDPSIEVVGTAPDAYIGRDKIINLEPDVVCLDVEMPKMDGVTFLKKMMQYKPLPVVMVSSLTKKGAKVTIEALESGAVDFVEKPQQNLYEGKEEIEKELIEKVKNASKVCIQNNIIKKVDNKFLDKKVKLTETTNKIIAIGSSTGGTVALTEFLTKLPRNIPGIVITQHMPAGFTKAFADRLNNLCEVDVKEAEDGEVIGKGMVLIAPGDFHMGVEREGGHYKVVIGTGKKISGHRPSVDYLFSTVAKEVGSNAIGIIMTGMGADGAKGLLKMKLNGSKTLGQSKESCVVYGMPKAAFELGAVEKEAHLNDFPRELLNILRKL